MSYILDALKKSDKERQKEKVPDLNTVHFESPAKETKTVWPYYLGVILLVNVVILAIFIGRDEPLEKPGERAQNARQDQLPVVQEEQTVSRSQSEHEASPAMVEKTAALVAPVEQDVVANQQEDFPEPSQNHAADVTTLQGNITVAETGNTAPAEMEEAADLKDPEPVLEEEAVESAIISEDVTEEITSEPDDVIATMDALIAKEAEELEREGFMEEQPEAPVVSKPRQKVDAPAASAPVETEKRAGKPPLHFRQLPVSIRKDLPEIHIDAHVYFKNPASRLASINGKMTREGYLLAPGLKVEEITTDGVVFSFRNYIFHVPVF